MGPTAAILGRDFELFMLEEQDFATCPVEVLENSIHTCWGTLNKQAFEQEKAWPTPNYSWGYPGPSYSGRYNNYNSYNSWNWS